LEQCENYKHYYLQVSEMVSDSDNLTEGQQCSLSKVLGTFPSFASSGLGKTTLVAYEIDVSDAKSIKQSHFPVSPTVEKLIFKEIDRMLVIWVIEESQSAYSSPVVLLQN